MNEVANRTAGTAVASLQALKQGLQNVKDSLPKVMGDALMRMLTDGTWCYGQENVEVEPGSLWAINPMSLQHGYICWTDWAQKQQPKRKNEVVGEVMRPMTAAKPLRDALPDMGDWSDNWKDQISFQMMCISGEDVGTQVLYKTTSVGGVGEVTELIAAIMQQLDTDPTKPVPCVDLQTDHYIHKQYGKTYTPVFDIQKWVPLSNDMPANGNGAAVEPTKPTEPEKPVVEAVATTAAAEPTRTRRRAATAQETKAADKPAEQAATAAAGPAAGEAVRRRRRVS